LAADANRERVVKAEAIPLIAGLLSELDLLPFVTAVLYNVMVDYGRERETILILEREVADGPV
jgi:hypothetical protein